MLLLSIITITLTYLEEEDEADCSLLLPCSLLSLSFVRKVTKSAGGVFFFFDTALAVLKRHNDKV